MRIHAAMVVHIILLAAPHAAAWHPLQAAPEEQRFDGGPYLVGAGGGHEDPPLFGVKTTGTGFGPFGDGVAMPKIPNSTSFRGPTAPPLTATPLDHTTKTKFKRFAWEKETKSNSSAIDAAAQAVHIIDSTGLVGVNAPMEGAQALGGPTNVSIKNRSTELADVAAALENSTEVSAATAPPEPAPVHGIPWDGPWDPIPRSGLKPQVTPAPGVQEAVNDFNKSGGSSGVLAAVRHNHGGAKHKHRKGRHGSLEPARPDMHHKHDKTKSVRHKHKIDATEEVLLRRARGQPHQTPRQ